MKRQKREALESRAWDWFRMRLDEANTLADAMKLANDQGIHSDTRGKQLYLNLAFFVRNLHPPARSSRTELDLYMKLVQRLGGARELPPEKCEQIQAALRKALEGKPRL
jgi:hypothetical protein